jgi:peroxiredoxin
VNKGTALMFLLAGLLGAGGGWWFHGQVLDRPNAPESPDPASLLGQKRPAFTLGSIDGGWVSASDFDGQVMLINFWATWCVPCRAEMPMLSDLHEAYSDQGFQVVGIALDDVQRAKDFAAELNIAYPVLVGMADVMATGRIYGNRSGLLPYSVLVDREGTVRWAQLGEVSETEVLEQVRPLL